MAPKNSITEGRLRPGSALPSFRALAEDLLVSVITVKRAYEELEREGIIYRKQGLGTFVADYGDEAAREAKRMRAEERLRDALKECVEAGMTEEEIAATLHDGIPDVFSLARSNRSPLERHR